MAAEPEPPTACPAPEPFMPETISAPYCPMDRVEVALLPRIEARPTLASKPLSGLKTREQAGRPGAARAGGAESRPH